MHWSCPKPGGGHRLYRSASRQDEPCRAIRPVHTNADGDSIYALSTGEMPGYVNVVGAMAALAMEKAIARATRTAESAYGLPGCRELGK